MKFSLVRSQAVKMASNVHRLIFPLGHIFLETTYSRQTEGWEGRWYEECSQQIGCHLPRQCWARRRNELGREQWYGVDQDSVYGKLAPEQ
jgi:hypothetical protein